MNYQFQRYITFPYNSTTFPKSYTFAPFRQNINHNSSNETFPSKTFFGR